MNNENSKIKIVGRKYKEPEITFHASAEKLKRCGTFNDEMIKFQKVLGFNGFFPKGVYHYKTHKEANKHWQKCTIKKVIEKEKNKWINSKKI